MTSKSTFREVIQRYKRTWREYTHHIESSVSVMSRLNALLPGMGGGTNKQLSLGAVALLIAMTTRRVHAGYTQKHVIQVMNVPKLMNVPADGSCFYHAIFEGLRAEGLEQKFLNHIGIPPEDFIKHLKEIMVRDPNYIKAVVNMFNTICEQIREGAKINFMTEYLADWTKDLFNTYIDHDDPGSVVPPNPESDEDALAAVQVVVEYNKSIQFGNILYNEEQRKNACSKVQNFVEEYCTRVLDHTSWANEPERSWIYVKLKECGINHQAYLKDDPPIQKDARDKIYLYNDANHWQYYKWITNEQ